jgi:hypothetical protein
LFKAKLTLVFRNSLKIDGLKFDLLEENFPISHFQNPKLTTTLLSDSLILLIVIVALLLQADLFIVRPVKLN